MRPRKSPARKCAAFRLAIAERTVVMPGVFNAPVAMLAERTGFEALYISGAGLINGTAGFPDIGLLGMEEVVREAGYIARAVEIPAICDADTGFGEALQVMRTVQAFERAGLAGIHLEDQQAPKRCGHLEGKTLISTEEMQRKLAAAAAARENPDFALIARCDARAVEGFDAAVERGRRYLDSGADAIFIEALETEEEFGRYADLVQGTLLANMTEFGKTPDLTAQQFGDLGYRMVIFPMTAFRVMMKAVEGVLAELKERGTPSALKDRMQTRRELYDLLRYDEYLKTDADLAGAHPEKPSKDR
ncbi:MAG: methylisocitrate lyase [Gemmatimonadetes bacterium]|nr:methylisocitrate lyase [Gemmatimonadota bacterium]